MFAGVTQSKVNRRLILKAAAMATLFHRRAVPARVNAQATAATQSATWLESIERGEVSAESRGDFYSIETPFPFTSLAAHWDGDVGTWPIIEVRLSADGESYSNITYLNADSDTGRATTDNRVHSRLVTSEPVSFVQYRITDRGGTAVPIDGFGLTWMNTTEGPGGADLLATGELGLDAPPLVTRGDWGADESLRFDGDQEIWPPEYAPISHLVLHHTGTLDPVDPVQTLRAIYFNHAATRGWGDIAYNYLVDDAGRIYEGRAGGPGVVGGHAFQYQHGSAGIAVIGDFSFEQLQEDAQAGLIGLLAWLAEDLDPAGVADIGTLEDVPVICGHRDVEETPCPGMHLYDELPAIRTLVSETVALRRSAQSFAPNEPVVVLEAVNLRAGPGTSEEILATLAAEQTATVLSGPVTADGLQWFEIDAPLGTGWVAGHYLAAVQEAESIVPAAFEPGANVIVDTDVLNLRTSPGRQSEIIAQLPQGSLATISGGPVSADGDVWWQVDTDAGTGWVVQIYLTLADD